MIDRPGFRLLAITPPAGPVDAGLVGAWSAGRAVGLAVLLREPGTSPAGLVAAGHRFAGLRRACAEAGVPCVLSVGPEGLEALGEALAVPGVVGVQLRGDPGVQRLEAARRVLGAARVLGRSCHGQPAGMGAWVDYSVLAPIFAPRTASPTPGPGKRAVGLGPLRGLAQREARVFALGGVTPERARACLEAGAWGLAAIRTFFGAPAVVADNVAHLAHAVVEAESHAAPSP